MYKSAALLVATLITCRTGPLSGQNVETCQQQPVLLGGSTIYRDGGTLSATCELPVECRQYRDRLLYLGSTSLPVTSDQVHGDRFTVSTQYRLSLADSGKVLRCSALDEMVTSADSHPYPGVPITVARPPLAVEQVDCVVHAYEVMNCTWVQKPHSGLETTHTMYFQHNLIPSSSFPESEYRVCPDQRVNVCVLRLGSMRYGVIALYVEANSTVGSNRSKRFTFNVSYIVKLSPVSSLVVSRVDTTWMTLHWSKPYRIQHLNRTAIYRITTNSSIQHIPASSVNVTSYKTNVTYNITGLTPFIPYTVTMQAFPLEYEMSSRSFGDAGFWNDPVRRQKLTLPDVPGVAPVVTSGGFLYDTHKKELKLFWKPVSRHELHGHAKYQRIGVYTRSENASISCDGESEYTNVNPAVSSMTRDLQPGFYDVCVEVGNDVGYNTSLLLQPLRISHGLVRPDFYAREAERGGLEVCLLEESQAVRYTLYWCPADARGSCQNKGLQWAYEEPGERTYFINTGVPADDAMVGLSAEYNTSAGLISSGLSFTSHVFNKPSGLIKMPTDVESVKDGPTDSILVQWRKPDRKNTVYIDHFMLQYWLEEEPGNKQEEEFDIQGALDGTVQTVPLRGLMEEHTYSIHVCSIGDGKNSSYTHPITVTVPRTGLSVGVKATIGVLSIVGFGLVVAGLYAIISKCRKTILVYREPIHIVPVPDFGDKFLEPTNGSMTDPYQDVQDAGYNTMNNTDISLKVFSPRVEPPSPPSPRQPEGHINPVSSNEEAALLADHAFLPTHNGTKKQEYNLNNNSYDPLAS